MNDSTGPDLKRSRRPHSPAIGADMDDRLPHSPEAERAALGSAILSPALAPELRPEWFYDLRNREVADALLKLATEAHGIDPAIVAHRLKQCGMESPETFVMELADACHSPANFPAWRATLADKLVLRSVITHGHTAIQAATEADRNGGNVVDVLDATERAALAIRTGHGAGDGDGTVDLRATLEELSHEYDRAEKEGKPCGLMTGFHDFDKLTGGFRPAQLVVIAARPAVGKTSLAMNIAEHIALDQRLPVGFASLEMSGKELVHRLACSRGRVDSARLNDGTSCERDKQRLSSASGQIVRAPLHIFARGGVTLAQLTAQARRWKQAHGIRLLIVDYLGLLRSGEKGRSRYEETTLVSNGLKCLAMELDLPVIALAQLNRDTEREGRVPRLSDLRDSGAIEQDADIVALLHRSTDEAGNEDTALVIGKNRSGATGRIGLVFRRQFTRFETMTRCDE